MAYSRWMITAGALGFILIVTFLHMIQPDYNPIEQQMSELALGRFGSLMFFGIYMPVFLGICLIFMASAISCTQHIGSG